MSMIKQFISDQWVNVTSDSLLLVNTTYTIGNPGQAVIYLWESVDAPANDEVAGIPVGGEKNITFLQKTENLWARVKNAKANSFFYISVVG